MDFYKMGREERKAAAEKGRKWMLGDGLLSREAMCNALVEGMDGAFENWTPKKKFKVIEL